MTTAIIAYSGHAYVAIDILNANSRKVDSYCDVKLKANNPYDLEYLGSEKEESVLSVLKTKTYFIAIGNNTARQEIYQSLTKIIQLPINAIHPTAFVSLSSKIGNGVMIGVNSSINAQTSIGQGVICNTACIIEHECIIEPFAHIAPGATIAGNVHIGERSLIGANAVIKQGVRIGSDVIIGAGSVILNDVPNQCTVVGNPGRVIKNNFNETNS